MNRTLLALLALAIVASCTRSEPGKHLRFEDIKVDHARLRTDVVGIGKWAEPSAYVLADAKNVAAEGAYVTLAGSLLDAEGKEISALRAQSIYIPGGERRTFALVDADRKPRPDAKGAKVFVRGANVPKVPPPAHVEQLHTFDDHGQLVLQAYVVNDTDRAGTLTVLASFHDADDLPIQRPFALVRLPALGRESVRFIGPKGAKAGNIYVGEVSY